MSRKQLRLRFTDFPGPTNPHALQRILSQDFDLILGDENPDVVFFSVFGNEHLRYPESLKIFFTGENVHPDSNLCDYAFGFDWMELEDRYYRCPNFVLYSEYDQLLDNEKYCIPALNSFLARPRFCNFIYSNSRAHPIRDKFFHVLSDYRPVDSAGLHLNTCGFTVEDKIGFQKQFRFTIAVENSSSPGYTTEKLVHALLAGTIPIYWGDPVVSRQFNTRRFINVHDFSSIDQVVDRVRSLEESATDLVAILNEPVFVSDEAKLSLSKEALRHRLKCILNQDKTNAKRRNRYVWGEIYEKRRLDETQNHGSLVRWAKRLERKLNRLSRA